MRFTHHPAKCPTCKAKTEIIFGNRLTKDEIVCSACGWNKLLPTSTVLSCETMVAMALRKIAADKDLKRKEAEKTRNHVLGIL